MIAPFTREPSVTLSAAALADQMRALPSDWLLSRPFDLRKSTVLTAASLVTMSFEQVARALGEQGPLTLGEWTVRLETSASPYHVPIVFARGRSGLVWIGDRTGKPDLAFDRLMLDKFGIQANHTPGAISRTALYVYVAKPKDYGPTTLSGTLAAHETDKWVSARLLESSAPIRGFGEEDDTREYMRMDGGQIGGDGMDALIEWFPLLRATIDTLGLSAAHAAAVAPVRTGPHADVGDYGPLYRDTALLARELAFRTDGLLGPEEFDAMVASATAAIEGHLELRSLAEAKESHAACVARGVTAPSEAIEGHDNSYFAHACGRWQGLAWHDQNREYALLWTPDAAGGELLQMRQWPVGRHRTHKITTLDAAALEEDAPSLLGRFTVSTDGRTVRASDCRTAEIDHIRTWHGLLFGTGVSVFELVEAPAATAPRAALRQG